MNKTELGQVLAALELGSDGVYGSVDKSAKQLVEQGMRERVEKVTYTQPLGLSPITIQCR